MKKNVAKIITTIVVFFIAIIVSSVIINQGNTDMTTEMSRASYPTVYMQVDGETVNFLRGYGSTMEDSYLRDTITPLMEERALSFSLKKYGNRIEKLSFEVRSVDGERLVENTEIYNYVEQDDLITATVSVKDLIEKNLEYNFILSLQTGDGRNIRYYTRIIQADNYHTKEKIAFAKDFHEKTFDKEAAEELVIYLESNADGDNTTFSKVNIHSSFFQITWGDLQVKRETEPEAFIREIAEQTASVELRYKLSMTNGKEVRYYNVVEYYRMRYGTERIYLLDFERTMNEIFNPENNSFANDKIMLGITGADIDFVESDDGGIFAFVQEDQLYSYNVTDNKFGVLFGFYTEKDTDARNTFSDHDVKILSVDETGNVRFLVYGYMNRGNHEGKVGVQVYYYNSSLNTVEEEVYIPYHKSYSLLKADLAQLVYANNTNMLYMILDGNLYCVNLMEKSSTVIAENLDIGGYKVSESNRMVAWQEGGLYNCSQLILMNLGSNVRTNIDAGNNEYIMPLGFMGEDLIYGLAYKADIVKDSSGNTLFPMHSLKIQNERQEVGMNYSKPDAYVIAAEVKDNQVNLARVVKNSEGTGYIPTEDDQITDKEVISVGRNTIEVIATEDLEKIVQIVVARDIETKNMKILTPREVLFEGGREIFLEKNEDVQNRYYVYGSRGVEQIFSNPGDAVMLADEISGVVINDKGNYVWIKGNRHTKNQIMAIEGALITEEKNSVAICLDTMLKYEGVFKNTDYLLRQNGDVMSILTDNLAGAQVLDMSGCSLDSVLYYVNRDIPVMALLEDGNAVLIVGFNELNTILMDPLTGEVRRKGMNDSKQFFEQNGNQFITYIK